VSHERPSTTYLFFNTEEAAFIEAAVARFARSPSVIGLKPSFRRFASEAIWQPEKLLRGPARRDKWKS
jgi:hypothetical protein